MSVRDDSPRRDMPGVPRWHADWLSITALSRAILAFAPELRGQRLLDIGCGNKPYRAFFPNITDYIGVDIAQTNSMADAVVLTHHLPFADEIFGGALCTQVLEHVAQPDLLLNEAARVLEPDGLLLLSAPMYWPHHEEPYDFFRYTRFGLQYLLENAGFQIVSISPQGGSWMLVGQAVANAFQESIQFRTFGLRALFLIASNTFFYWLDQINRLPKDTCNFVVLARKRREH